MFAPASLRLVSVFPQSPLGRDVLARGGRCFAVRHPGSPVDADLLVALPAAPAPRQVLVPRGLGRPLLARPVGQAWQEEGTGESCSARRWMSIGGLAARVRTLRLPAGPSDAAPKLRRAESTGEGLWLSVRLASPHLAAVARLDPSLRRGPVAVVNRRVCDVSAAAAAAGVARGMSPALARRKCPELRVVPAAGSARDAALALLESEVGEVVAVRSGLLVRVATRHPAEAMAIAEHVALRLWQALGVRCRLCLCADGQAATQVSGLLEADQVAFIPGSAHAVWRRAQRSARGRSGSWAGPEVVDLEGIVGLARAVVGTSGAGTLHLSTNRGRRAVHCTGEASAAAQVEMSLRALALELGAVSRLRWVAAPALRPGQQMRLALGR